MRARALLLGAMLHFTVSFELCRVILVFQQSESLGRLPANKVDGAAYDDISNHVVCALYYELAARVKGPLGNTIVELGFQTLGKVLKPLELSKESCLYLILFSICQLSNRFFKATYWNNYYDCFGSRRHHKRRSKIATRENLVIAKSSSDSIHCLEVTFAQFCERKVCLDCWLFSLSFSTSCSSLFSFSFAGLSLSFCFSERLLSLFPLPPYLLVDSLVSSLICYDIHLPLHEHKETCLVAWLSNFLAIGVAVAPKVVGQLCELVAFGKHLEGVKAA